jgi:hypothetical protein
MPQLNQGENKEISILEERLSKFKEAISQSKEEENISEKELIKEAIKERISEALPPPSPLPITPPKSIEEKMGIHDREQHIKAFVDIAMKNDIPTAVKAVVKTGNAHLIDDFHDALVDEFYEELKKLGKIK